MGIRGARRVPHQELPTDVGLRNFYSWLRLLGQKLAGASDRSVSATLPHTWLVERHVHIRNGTQARRVLQVVSDRQRHDEMQRGVRGALVAGPCV